MLCLDPRLSLSRHLVFLAWARLKAVGFLCGGGMDGHLWQQCGSGSTHSSSARLTTMFLLHDSATATDTHNMILLALCWEAVPETQRLICVCVCVCVCVRARACVRA
jgi:hypothetical protein